MVTVVMKNWEPLLKKTLLVRFQRRSELAKEDIRVGTSVGHGEKTRAVVLEDEVLIGELVTVDGATTGTLSKDKLAANSSSKLID